MPDNPVSKKFSVNVPDEIADDLQRWADAEGRNRANLCAFLLELAVRQRYPEMYPPKGFEGDKEKGAG